MRPQPVTYRWVICPACGNLVLMRAGDIHAAEMVRSECQGPRHAR